MNQKAKLAIGLVLLAAAGGYAYWTLSRSGARPPKSDQFAVCVETGREFVFESDKTRLFPMKNPETGRRTVYPAIRRDDGIYLIERYAGNLTHVDGEPRWVDRDTLRVRPPQ